MPDIEIIPSVNVLVTQPTIVVSVDKPDVSIVINAISLSSVVTIPAMSVDVAVPTLEVEFDSICVTEGADDAMFNQFLELGEDISINKVVYLDNGLIYKASQDDPNKIGAIGVLLEAGLVGNSRTVRTGGVYSYSGWNWNLSPGKKIYLGVDGDLTQTTPSTGHFLEIGYPITANTIMIDIEEPISL